MGCMKLPVIIYLAHKIREAFGFVHMIGDTLASSFCHCERSEAISEQEIPRFTRNRLRNLKFKNVVAQFIGQLCLMNQATTKSGARPLGFWPFDIV